MRLHMTNVGIFCRLFLLIGHMDQQIKPVTLIVAVDDRQETAVVEFQDS
jgi:hypothetical protein